MVLVKKYITNEKSKVTGSLVSISVNLLTTKAIIILATQ